MSQVYRQTAGSQATISRTKHQKREVEQTREWLRQALEESHYYKAEAETLWAEYELVIQSELESLCALDSQIRQ